MMLSIIFSNSVITRYRFSVADKPWKGKSSDCIHYAVHKLEFTSIEFIFLIGLTKFFNQYYLVYLWAGPGVDDLFNISTYFLNLYLGIRNSQIKLMITFVRDFCLFFMYSTVYTNKYVIACVDSLGP